MNPHPPSPLPSLPEIGLLHSGPAFPPPSLVEGDLIAFLWIAGALLASGLFSTLRAALQRSHPGRLRDLVNSPRRMNRAEARVVPLLERAERLETSAAVLKDTCDLMFGLLVLDRIAGNGGLDGRVVAVWLAVCVPSISLFTEVLPRALALRYGDRLLLTALPAFQLAQTPVGFFVAALQAVRRALLRALRVRENSPSTRRIVEGLREVIEESAISDDLDATERELIENVMDFREVDAAAVMTPRTEINGVDVKDGIPAAVRVAAESGHSRIPVYEDSLDTIIGTFSARDLVQLAADGRLEEADLRKVIHPPYFVPETKQVTELLTEFRREKLKIAIVLDEYGGTAGLVTLGDVVAEIVGEVHDEFDSETPAAVQRIDEHQAEVLASLHVSEVNEDLGLDLSEEADYETLGGFVLASLGRFPKEGESFVHGDAEFTVLEASDRRVIKVLVRRFSSELGRRDAS